MTLFFKLFFNIYLSFLFIISRCPCVLFVYANVSTRNLLRNMCITRELSYAYIVCVRPSRGYTIYIKVGRDVANKGSYFQSLNHICLERSSCLSERRW